MPVKTDIKTPKAISCRCDISPCYSIEINGCEQERGRSWKPRVTLSSRRMAGKMDASSSVFPVQQSSQHGYRVKSGLACPHSSQQDPKPQAALWAQAEPGCVPSPPCKGAEPTLQSLARAGLNPALGLRGDREASSPYLAKLLQITQLLRNTLPRLRESCRPLPSLTVPLGSTGEVSPSPLRAVPFPALLRRCLLLPVLPLLQSSSEAEVPCSCLSLVQPSQAGGSLAFSIARPFWTHSLFPYPQNSSISHGVCCLLILISKASLHPASAPCPVPSPDGSEQALTHRTGTPEEQLNKRFLSPG